MRRAFRSDLDVLLSYGTVELQSSPTGTRVIARFRGNPFMPEVPVALGVMADDGDDALMDLRNKLVDELSKEVD